MSHGHKLAISSAAPSYKEFMNHGRKLVISSPQCQL